MLSALPVSAETFTANSSATLKQAITDANANSEADIIEITANITITSTEQLPNINNYSTTNEGLVTIRGNGHTINGADTYRIFYFDGKGGSVENITLTNSRGPALGLGQCCDDGGRLTVSNVVVRDTASGGANNTAIYIGGGKNIVSMRRVAVYNNQTRGITGTSINEITIENSSIFGNTGDGIYVNAQSARVMLRHVTITGNGGKGVNYDGGGNLFDARNSIIYGNTGQDCKSMGWAQTVVRVSGSIIGANSDAPCKKNQSSANPLLTLSAVGTYYQLESGSPAINAVSCIVGVDQRGVSRGCPCDIGAFEFDTSDSCEEEAAAPGPAAKPTAVWDRSSSCGRLPREIEAIGFAEGTQCQRVDAVGIGNAEVVAAGFRDGVDVWGWAPAGMRVCWRVASGSFKFIDTGVMPRTVEDLPAHSYNGMTCTTINRIGMVALLPGPAAPAPAAMATAIPSTDLMGCMVRTQYALNLRDAPAGEVIGAVGYDWTLTALSRTPGWFEVDNNGVTGWIAAMYVEPIGNCG